MSTNYAQVVAACGQSINNYESSTCIDTLNSVCSQGNNAATNPVCTNWLKQHCTADNINGSQICRDFLNGAVAQGQMDNVMSTYCKRYPNDEMCSCINSQLPCPNKQDSGCITRNGYITSAMLKNKCAPVISCSQQVNLSPSALNLALFVEQDCFGTTTGGLLGMTLFTWICIIMFILVIITYAIFSSDNNNEDCALMSGSMRG
jgi:hypothetical protein